MVLDRPGAVELPTVVIIGTLSIERRRGKRVTAKRTYYDLVPPSTSHVVKSTGLRWISMKLLTPIPWPRCV